MNILGINAYHGNSSAAIVCDGRLVAAVEEERFNRVKYAAGFPAAAIRYCLDAAGITLAEVDHIAIPRNPWDTGTWPGGSPRTCRRGRRCSRRCRRFRPRPPSRARRSSTCRSSATPSTRRRRDISRATSSWLFVQPAFWRVPFPFGVSLVLVARKR